MARHLAIVHLQVGERRLSLRVPVDQPLAAIDEAVVVQPFDRGDIPGDTGRRRVGGDPADVDVREHRQRVGAGVATLYQVGDRPDEFVELRPCDTAVDADPLDSACSETTQ